MLAEVEKSPWWETLQGGPFSWMGLDGGLELGA